MDGREKHREEVGPDSLSSAHGDGVLEGHGELTVSSNYSFPGCNEGGVKETQGQMNALSGFLLTLDGGTLYHLRSIF